MTTTAQPESDQPPRRNFVLYFMAFMLLASAVTFVTFTYVARQSKAQRREISHKNLTAMFQALRAFAADPANSGQFPAELPMLIPKYLQDPNALSHPAWPNRAGYVYIPGVKMSDPQSDTIVVYENVPAGKEKLGRLALCLNGEVHMWDEAEFRKRISAQEQLWKSQGRSWREVAVEPVIQVK